MGHVIYTHSSLSLPETLPKESPTILVDNIVLVEHYHLILSYFRDLVELSNNLSYKCTQLHLPASVYTVQDLPENEGYYCKYRMKWNSHQNTKKIPNWSWYCKMKYVKIVHSIVKLVQMCVWKLGCRFTLPWLTLCWYSNVLCITVYYFELRQYYEQENECIWLRYNIVTFQMKVSTISHTLGLDTVTTTVASATNLVALVTTNSMAVTKLWLCSSILSRREMYQNLFPNSEPCTCRTVEYKVATYVVNCSKTAMAYLS